jgi:hypothetical protein
MSTILRIENVSRSLLAMLCLSGGLVACTTQEATPNGTGGSGVSPAGTGGSTVGAGGNTAAAGSTGAATGLGTLCPPPQQVITNFTYTPSDAGTADTTAVRFGSSGTLQGGESFYPGAGSTFPLTSDVTQSNWHITGTVGDYSGFALYFDSGSTPCDRVDASQFKGISFTISGSVPHGSAITMGVGTVKDTPSGTWMLNPGGKTTAKATDVGSCTPTSGNQYYHPGCGDPTTQIPITAAPVPQNVTWADLTGGTPVGSPDPSGITSIYWFFPWTGSTDTSYAVDITIDNLAFIP